jgi:hypothetical protein
LEDQQGELLRLQWAQITRNSVPTSQWSQYRQESNPQKVKKPSEPQPPTTPPAQVRGTKIFQTPFGEVYENGDPLDPEDFYARCQKYLKLVGKK